MKKVSWTIGNTTVRNPERLMKALRIFKERIEGKNWNERSQEEFLQVLIERGLYKPLRRKTREEIERHGRIWGSVPKKLGFIHVEGKKGKLSITPVGNALLEGKYLEEEIYLRQLLKIQINGTFPFYTSLKMIYELGGMTKEEMGIFLFTTTGMSEIDKVVSKVKTFRKKLAKIKGRNEKRKFARVYHIKHLAGLYGDELKERLGLVNDVLKKSRRNPKFVYSSKGEDMIRESAKGGKGMRTKKVESFVKDFRRMYETYTSDVTRLNRIKERLETSLLLTKSESLNSYGDLNFRYLQKTGLFTIKGNKLTIAEEYLRETDAILSMKFTIRKGENYSSYLHNPIEPPLPSDSEPFVFEKITGMNKQLEVLYTSFEIPIEKRKRIKVKPMENIAVLRKKYKEIENEYILLKELQFAEELQKSRSIHQVIEYFDSILSGEILGDRASHLEWNVWRAFLTLNELIVHPSKCRNFTIDKDLNPYNFASGNQPDMVFYYDNFIVVGETTLTTGPTQWRQEAEPVPRHIAKIQAGVEKKVYGIFIAPRIDVNTAMTFFGCMTSVPYVHQGRKMRLTIIPLTTKQFCDVIFFHAKQNLTLKNLRELLELIKNLKDNKKITDGEQWLKRMPQTIDEWKRGLVSFGATGG